MMEHENAYGLMMDALDGDLTGEGRNALQVHLQACPSCAREWHALTAIDTLFRQTPAVAPTAGFVQRTMTRLPSRRLRLGVVGLMYVLLLLGGLLPLWGGIWLASNYGPLLTEASWLSSVAETAVALLQIGGTVVSALLTGAGEFMLQYPATMGWLLMLAGSVALWRGVYQQFTWQSAPVMVQNR